jgi:hypothetical protein
VLNHGAARPGASHSERSEKSVVSDISPINAAHHSVAVRHAHAQSAPNNRKVLVDRPITIPPGAKLALSAEAGAPEGMEDSDAFVMNVARLVGGTGFALGAGYELRRANTEESAVIKETLQRGHGDSQERCRGSCGYSPGGSVEPLEEAE